MIEELKKRLKYLESIMIKSEDLKIDTQIINATLDLWIDIDEHFEDSLVEGPLVDAPPPAAGALQG